jgi:hypothetical protein
MQRPVLDLNQALSYDPFSGDMDGEVVRFTDKIVTARKYHRCHHCGDTIKPKEKGRTRVDKFDDTMTTYRWCSNCTAIMAMGDGQALEVKCRR